MAKLILQQVAQFSSEEMCSRLSIQSGERGCGSDGGSGGESGSGGEGLHVLFSAHGVPESYILGEGCIDDFFQLNNSNVCFLKHDNIAA